MRNLILSIIFMACLHSPTAAVTISSDKAIAPSSPEQAVHTLINSYFTSWSNKDWPLYADHFDKQAFISYCTPKMCRPIPLQRFLSIQRNTNADLTEVPTSIATTADGNGAISYVEWQLYEKSKATKTGVDLFTFVKREGQPWKIISLVWYEK